MNDALVKCLSLGSNWGVDKRIHKLDLDEIISLGIKGIVEVNENNSLEYEFILYEYEIPIEDRTKLKESFNRYLRNLKLEMI